MIEISPPHRNPSLGTPHFHVWFPLIPPNCSRERSPEHCHSKSFLVLEVRHPRNAEQFEEVVLPATEACVVCERQLQPSRLLLNKDDEARPEDPSEQGSMSQSTTVGFYPY